MASIFRLIRSRLPLTKKRVVVASGAGPAVGDGLLMESGDYVLMESGDYILLE